MSFLIKSIILLMFSVLYCFCERVDPATKRGPASLLGSTKRTSPAARSDFQENLEVLRGPMTRIDYDYDDIYVKLATEQRCTSSGTNCTANYQPLSTVAMIETNSNRTFRDFLHICTEIEPFEIDLNGDIDLAIDNLFQQTFLLENNRYSNIIVLINVEETLQFAAIDILQAITDVSQNFFSRLHFYADFDDISSLKNDTVFEELEAWLAHMCQSISCADYARLVVESIASIDITNNGTEVDSLVSSWCQRLGFSNAMRIVDLVPDTSVKVAGSEYQESSLVLSDILPLNQKSYDKNRPPKYQNQPTVVYFHVTVLSLDTINEESMTYVADVFLAQSWRDHRLRLPENMTSDYRILDVVWLQHIWRPDSFFKNAKKVTFHEMSVPNHYLWLYYDKTLLYMTKLTLVLSCAMKFEAYPHDTQICSIMIESLSHTTDDLVFKWNVTDPLVTNPDIELPQLDIARNTTEDCTLEYSTGNFTCLAVVFNLKRRLGYHLFHTYIPSALIVVMSWISFWIKPEAIPARVTLGVTSLLTLATQSTQSQRSLPPVSYVKAIDVWMSSCTVFVFMSLMEFAVVNNFMGPVATKLMKGYSDEDVSNAQFRFTNGRASIRSRSSAMGVAAAPGPQYVTFCNGREVALFIDKWSRLFFPFSFIILNIVYWTTFYV